MGPGPSTHEPNLGYKFKKITFGKISFFYLLMKHFLSEAAELQLQRPTPSFSNLTSHLREYLYYFSSTFSIYLIQNLTGHGTFKVITFNWLENEFIHLCCENFNKRIKAISILIFITSFHCLFAAPRSFRDGGHSLLSQLQTTF